MEGARNRFEHPRVGMFGLGNMGLAVASRLATCHDVLAFDPNAERRELATKLDGIRVLERPEDVVAGTVVLSLPLARASHDMVEVIISGGSPGGIVIETSTVNPWEAQEMHDRAAERSWSFIDAAILSGVAQMYSGAAALLIGGSEADVRRAAPVLDTLSRRQRHLGPVGAGMAAKVINNAIAHAVMVVLAEAGALAVGSGVSGEQLAELLQEPDGGLMRPLTHRYVERVLRGAFGGGMPTEAARKDSVLALELAQHLRVPLFAIQGAHTVYELGVAAGLARDDYAAIATLWERWTGRSMVSPPAGVAEGGM